jgi:hypothetical protein
MQDSILNPLSHGNRWNHGGELLENREIRRVGVIRPRIHQHSYLYAGFDFVDEGILD